MKTLTSAVNVLTLIHRLLWGALILFAAEGVQAQNKPSGDLPKYGLYLHFGLPTFCDPNLPREQQIGNMSPEMFKPAGFDARGWVRTARLAGMDFAMLVVKWDDGFCLWPAKDYDFHVGSSPVKFDIVGEYITACNAEGIKPGVHYSIPDAYSEGQIKRKGNLAPAYFETVKKHITHLHTKYPGIRIQIFDGEARLTPEQFVALCGVIKKINPSCMVIMWAGSIEKLDPNRKCVAFGYDCDTVNKSWMWRRNEQLISAQKLADGYRKSVANGDAFILNVGVDQTGHIPAASVAILMEVKALIASNGSAAQPSAAKATAVERLKQLKELNDLKMISKEDYDKKVKEIMDTL